jgi:hypothetical protein
MRVRLLTLLLCAACTKELADLEPIACPKDGLCLDGLACIDGVCQKPRVDSRCDTIAVGTERPQDSVDCSLVGGDISCWNGYCEQSCGSFLPPPDGGAGACAVGRVCVANRCLADCTDGGACPSGMVCRQVGDGPTKACLLSNQYVPACQSYLPVSSASCYTCGAANFVVQCGNNRTCVNGSTCDPGGTTCTCTDDYDAFTCAGQLCTGGVTCNYPNWYCRPKAITTPTCQTIQYGSGTCMCSDGRTVSRSCTTTSCEELCTLVR